MEFQLRPTDLPMPGVGMDFGWQPGVYNKFISNSHYALDAQNTSMQGMPNHLYLNPK
jgi:hypothetical protein